VKNGLRNAGAASLAVEDFTRGLHQRWGKTLRISQPDDEQLLRAQAARGWREKERLAEFAAEQIRFADEVKQAFQLFVHLGPRALQRLHWG
jgi:hypothetical protein